MAKITDVQFNRVESRIIELNKDLVMYNEQAEAAGSLDRRENEGYHSAREGIRITNLELEGLVDLKSKVTVIPVSNSKVYDIGSLVLVQFDSDAEPNHIKDLKLDREYVNKCVKALESYSGDINELWNLGDYEEDIFNYPELYFGDKRFLTRMFLIEDYGNITSGVLNQNSPIVSTILGKPESLNEVNVPIPNGSTVKVYIRKLPKIFEERFKAEYPVNYSYFKNER